MCSQNCSRCNDKNCNKVIESFPDMRENDKSRIDKRRENMRRDKNKWDKWN